MEAAVRSSSLTRGEYVKRFFTRIGTDNVHSVLAWRTANEVYTLANFNNFTIDEARSWAIYGARWEMVS